MTEIRIAGSGGQGVALAGLLLAEAAVISGSNATHAQAYGPESRGGASRADVIVREGDIDFPFARSLDILVALTPEALRRHAGDLVPGGLLIVDGTSDARTDVRQVSLPLTNAARAELGVALGANLVALGALVGSSDVVPVDAAERAIAVRSPGGSTERALKAFRLGLRLARQREGWMEQS